jgi:tripartite-type tricarboxylate transporter receptor subunit TctC
MIDFERHRMPQLDPLHGIAMICSRLFLKLCCRGIAMFALCGMIGSAFAQSPYPSRPVRIIVGLGPGTLDVLARMLAKSLGQDLNGNFIVENRPGAGGSIGGALVARAEKDGYTIGMFNSGVVTTAVTAIPDLSYDPLKDFTPIGTMASNPVVFGVAANSRFKTLDDMLATARREPGRVSCGLNGVGTHSDIIIDVVSLASGAPITHVPFSGGSGTIIAAVLGGQIDCYSGVAPSLYGQVRSGKMRIIASTSPLRELPEVPTFASKGYPQVSLEVFFATFGPSGLPRDVTGLLVSALRKALVAPDNIAQMEKMGLDVVYEAPPQLMERVARDLAAVIDVARKNRGAAK